MKDHERTRRTLKATILKSDISRATKLPKDISTFWPSVENKSKLENFLKRCITEHFMQKDLDVHIFLSGTVPNGDNDISAGTQSVQNGKLFQHSELDSNLEEVDVRIIPHALHAVRNGIMQLVILSSDTDVFVLEVYFSYFARNVQRLALWSAYLQGPFASVDCLACINP